MYYITNTGQIALYNYDILRALLYKVRQNKNIPNFVLFKWAMLTLYKKQVHSVDIVPIRTNCV